MKKSLHSPEHQILCGLLRELRLEAGLSQDELAEKLNVPQSLISRIEVGERRLDILELRQYCSAVQTTMSRFVRRLEARMPAR